MLKTKDSTYVIIPARSGSKRLERKNSRIIAGKRLIEWTIEAALSCFDAKNICVSTDDDDLLSIAESRGLVSNGKRPEGLCSDESTTRDVILYELDEAKIYQGNVLILQPTSPLRTSNHIRQAMSLYNEKKANGVVSVCECEHPPEWSNTLPSDFSMESFVKVDQIKRSQDFSKSYRLNGALYLHDVQKYRSIQNPISSSGTFAYLMDKVSSIDIDDIFDFQIAEFFLIKKSLN